MSAESDKRWFRRNSKWLVPLLGASLLVSLGGIVFAVVGLTRSSDVYRMAVTLARSAPAVAKALGEPIGEGYFTTGSIRVSGPSGHASLAIPLSGPQGSGTVFVEGTKSLGEWSLSRVVFASASNERIDLLAADGSTTRVAADGSHADNPDAALAEPRQPVAATRDQYLIQKWQAAPAIADVLADLPHRLGPDDVLERVRIRDDGSIELQLLTDSVARLLKQLAASVRLAHPDVQQTQVDAGSRKQRLTIAAAMRTDVHRSPRDGKTFLASRNSGDAYSELSHQLQNAVQATHAGDCTIVSTQNYRDNLTEPVARASLQVRLHCGLPALTAMLADVENGLPLLFVTQFELSPYLRYAPPGSGPLPPLYDIRLTLFGYLDEPAS